LVVITDSHLFEQQTFHTSNTMKFFAFVLLAGIALASASCPNQCSGHGRCGANDKCTCYTQTGTYWSNRDGWTGADCSLRTCPLATAWDQISTQSNRVFDHLFTTTASGNDKMVAFKDESYNMAEDKVFLVKIVTATTTAGTFKWKYDTDDDYTAPIAVPLNHWTAYELGNYTGLRIYWTPASLAAVSTDLKVGDLYTITATHNDGVDFDTRNDNTAHQKLECAGRGMCDRKTGQCDCFVGYTGEACARTSCPNDCSGHGICQDLRRFAADAGSSYTNAWDANAHMGCLCDGGYRGPDCSLMECPSGADPLGADGGTEGRDCSGRGVCDYSSGQCNCFKGYFGERCESQTNYV
jgi:hypothetical protein